MKATTSVMNTFRTSYIHQTSILNGNHADALGVSAAVCVMRAPVGMHCDIQVVLPASSRNELDLPPISSKPISPRADGSAN